jgi:ABC-type Fe3+ transport system substrate-binding protein
MCLFKSGKHRPGFRGLAKNAPHKGNALKLIKFLASDEGQEMYAEMNNEYPVKEGVPWSPLIKSWGGFKPADLAQCDRGLTQEGKRAHRQGGLRRRAEHIGVRAG